jgi:peptide/nickel transport system ATP-binding protein
MRENMSNNDTLLAVKDLTKIFTIGGGFSRGKLVAVNKANFEIKFAHPEIFTLAGESGSGKTTLARMILGLIEPTHGSILYKSKDITKIKRKKERMWFTKEVQPIFQNPFETFNPLKKVDTYLYETVVNYGIVHNKKDANQILEKFLNAVGFSLEEIQGRYPNELSGGQLQRVSIARALMTDPSLLIADEPVSMVDTSVRMSIVNLFKKLKDRFGVTVIYITHDLATAYYISDHIAIMLRGIIVEMGPVEKILVKPLHPYTQILKQSVPDPDPAKKWKKEIKLSTLEMKEFARSGCKFAERCPCVMDICRKQDPEDISVDERVIKCHLYKKK